MKCAETAALQYSFDGNSYKVWIGYESIGDDEKPGMPETDGIVKR